MGKNTSIQRCDSSANPTMGCDGCELWNASNNTCYAGRLHQLRGGRKGFAKSFDTVERFPGRTADAARWPDLSGQRRPDKPWLDGQPRLIFLSDMSDALSKSISFEYLKEEVIDVVCSEKGQRHRWLWLTKQTKRMAKLSQFIEQPWPRNLWVGTSVTTQATTKRLNHLLRVGDQDTIRFVSVEPQWEAITLGDFLPDLDWVIQGGQSGNIERPFSLEWARALRDECQSHPVPYFLKQLGACVLLQGERINFKDTHGGDWTQWPKDLRVREVPQHVIKPLLETPVRQPAMTARSYRRRIRLEQVA